MDPLELTPEGRRQCLERIARYFREERGEELGDLGQLLIYDFVKTAIAPLFYNRGLDEATRRVEQLLAGVSEDLEAWKRFPPPPGRLR